jgi:cold shock CspA family protein
VSPQYHWDERQFLTHALAGFVSDLPDGAILSVLNQKSPFLVELEIGSEARLRATIRAEEDIPAVFSDIQQEVIEFSTGTAWPECPIHGFHPLRAKRGGWVCDLDRSEGVSSQAQRVAPYGSIAQLSKPALSIANGTLRWFRPDWGWGIIADDQGDIWFHRSDLSDLDVLPAPGALVRCTINGTQGLFRRAAAGSVKPI